MDRKIEYRIAAHENGWAVFAGDVLKAVYPSRHLALGAAKELQSDQILNGETSRPAATTRMTLTDAPASSGSRASTPVVVAVPCQVDTPLKKRSGEISFPSSIEGHDLTAGKI